MKYKIADLQLFTHPKAEEMFKFPRFGFVEFEFPGIVRTLLFIHCGEIRGSRRGGEDYYQIVGRIYESLNPEAENENHIGKLYVDVYGYPDNIRFETKVERLKWHPDGSFELIEPDGQKTRFEKPIDYSTHDKVSSPPPYPPDNRDNRGIETWRPSNPQSFPVATTLPNQTLPIVSLGLGIVGVVTICCWGGFPFGLAAIVTGVLGMYKAINEPERFGGRGFAIAGVAIGSIILFASIVWAVIAILSSIR